MAFAAQSCTLIDDDLTVCGKNYQLNYEMRLVTNMDIELDLVLNAVTDSVVKRMLRRDLSTVFSDHAHDVDLSFFRTADGERSYYRNEIIDDNRSSFTFYLPKESYRHLAIANIDDALTVEKTDSLSREYLSLRNIAGDTLPSQSTGLFSARLDMEVQDSIDQEFDVHLYMVNSAMALIIDTTDCTVRDINVFTTGTGCGFNLNDSVFDFSRKPVIRAKQVKTTDDPSAISPYNQTFSQATASKETMLAYTSVNFPSDNVLTADGFWQVYVYVTMPDNKVTQNILKIGNPANMIYINEFVPKFTNVNSELKGIIPNTTRAGVNISKGARLNKNLSTPFGVIFSLQSSLKASAIVCKTPQNPTLLGPFL